MPPFFSLSQLFLNAYFGSGDDTNNINKKKKMNNNNNKKKQPVVVTKFYQSSACNLLYPHRGNLVKH